MFAPSRNAVPSPVHRSSFVPVPPLEDWAATLRHAARLLATRRTLETLDARLLRDIGVSRAEALEEAGRAPWDIGRPRS